MFLCDKGEKMKINIELPDYDGNAVDVIWGENAKYNLKICDNTVILSANKEGLISLAKQMLYFAHNDLMKGDHVHLDGFFTKMDNIEYELIIEKDD